MKVGWYDTLRRRPCKVCVEPIHPSRGPIPVLREDYNGLTDPARIVLVPFILGISHCPPNDLVGFVTRACDVYVVFSIAVRVVASSRFLLCEKELFSTVYDRGNKIKERTRVPLVHLRAFTTVNSFPIIDLTFPRAVGHCMAPSAHLLWVERALIPITRRVLAF